MPIEFERLDSAKFNGYCEMCVTPTHIYKTHVRIIMTPEPQEDADITSKAELILCPRHEHLLLERLVNNYAKRHGRGNKGHPKALPLRKETD